MALLRDSIPPHSEAAEEAVLGAVLLDWQAIGRVIAYLRPERFYLKRNEIVFATMLSLFQKGEQCDLLTLCEELRSAGQLDAAGGVAYVTSLTDTVPTSANVEYYARVVLDSSIRRDLIKIAAEVTADSHDETKEARTVLEEAQNKIYALTDLNNTYDIKDPRDKDFGVLPVINLIEQRTKNREAYTGIPSGLTELDALTSGFQNSEFIIIGARPSMGKTALALSMAQHMALDQNIPVGFFTLEMSMLQIMLRMLTQESKIPAEHIKNGFMKISDFQRLQDAGARLYEAPLCLVDAPNMKLLDLRALARRMVSAYHVKIIFIDYISLVSLENTYNKPRFEQIAEISRSLKSLARELEIPLVVLSQVSRDAEEKEPNLANLRESGSIEQDADVVLFIHRDRQKQAEESPQQLEAKLIVAKQRNGPIGTVKIVFLPQFTKFENLARG
ncbi:replicative DNA helicase [Treponema endosymbiont of Eucomonympha sp.]|uniref:replicative DNA helicase n=4 Tax=Treponema endosymbiont of Eucomonympha sp. TaxID=1580831 RepID=UPI000751751A|nr:replicative DNA helicase [Treponema endosymbiont of Eucomonympha sp.]